MAAPLDFVHLHVHSEYSLLDGLARIPALAEAAAAMGFTAMALTDHGAVYGAVPFVKAMRAAGVKPIVGAELYVVDEYGPPPRPAAPYHLTVLAADTEGYVHLLELISLANLDHFHRKPLLTLSEIAPRAGGLIALSGCVRGQLPRLALAGDTAGLRRALRIHGEIFGRDRFYLELQRHGLPDEDRANRILVDLALAEGVALIATNDVHYLTREESATHDLLLSIQTLSLLAEENRLRLPGKEYYLKPAGEMAALFADLPAAAANTRRVAEECRDPLQLGRRLIPAYPLPPGRDARGFLRELCETALPRLYPDPGGRVQARLDYELEVIDRLGFAGYFLIVWDIVSFARRRNIPVGPGRGSSVGSLAAYLLGITSVDPLANGLLFERFLNPDRAEMPDIDIDLCHRGRARVLEYIREKYGRDHVAHLAAFTTLRPRAAVRDVGRALGLAYEKVDRLAKTVPFAAADLASALADSGELRRLAEGDRESARVLAAARRIEGLPRHLTQHAAGVVVAAEPLSRYVALQKAGEGEIVVQADMKPVEDLGLLKIDLLGLRYLTVIDDTLAFLRADGIDLNAGDVPDADPATVAAMAAGTTMGTFQLESTGMRRLLRRFKPRTTAELALVIALYRPGPLGGGMVESLIRRRRGEEPVVYPHPLLEGILAETYGLLVYQEQVMQAAGILAGYEPARADNLRKAISKRRPDLLTREREGFMAGARDRGIAPAAAAAVFELIERFGCYGFAKAHSVAYALTSYRTVYLKTHYPVAYHAALLTLNQGLEHRFSAYLSEARRLGIELRGPEINLSGVGFAPAGGAIQAGLILVKDLGAKGVAAILREREAHGSFCSLADFYHRLRGKGVTARGTAGLIRAGAFDAFGGRMEQMAALQVLNSGRGSGFRRRRPGQLPLFSREDLGPLASTPGHTWPEYDAYVREEMEHEALGCHLTRHPLERYRAALPALGVRETADLTDSSDYRRATLCGLLTGFRPRRTRTGRRMLLAQIEDLSGRIEAVFFPAVLEKYSTLIRSGSPLLVTGRLDNGNDKVSFRVESVRGLPDGAGITDN